MDCEVLPPGDVAAESSLTEISKGEYLAILRMHATAGGISGITLKINDIWYTQTWSACASVPDIYVNADRSKFYL